jgi:hypothetical protein
MCDLLGQMHQGQINVLKHIHRLYGQ